MYIQSGKLFKNKTFKCLYPCLNYYKDNLINKLNVFFKVAVGINNKDNATEIPCLHILIDTKNYKKVIPDITYKENLDNFLNYIKYQDYYVKDYLYTRLSQDNLHMVVIKIPTAHKETYKHFLDGKYSKMYSNEEIESYFAYKEGFINKDIEQQINENLKEVRDVLFKADYLQTLTNYQNKIEEEFNVKLSLDDISNHERDLPPKYYEEMFNVTDQRFLRSKEILSGEYLTKNKFRIW